MTPVPIDLPLRPSEAAALAELIYEQIGDRPLSDDARSRLAGRTSVLGLKTLTPYFGSLEADPLHPATYYLAADGLSGPEPAPLLLHMAPASAPASGLFPKALLIGRMRPTAGREIVMNAIAFGREDTASISTYAKEVSRVFLPRARGAVPLIWVDTAGDPRAASAALAAFRAILRSTGVNLAGLRCSAGIADFWPLVWAAVRAGYRDGYSISGDFDPEAAKWFSCFRVRPHECEAAVHAIRTVRGGVPFDLEVDLRAGDDPVETHERLKSMGIIPQFALTTSGIAYPGALPSRDIAPETIEEARSTRQQTHGACALTVRWDGNTPAVASLLEALR